MAQIIPLTTDPNQTFQVSLNVDGSTVNLQLTLRYNEISEYWIMTIANPSTGAILLDSLPLITGEYPAGNILRQYSYLGIGSAYVLNMGSSLDYPDDSELGNSFVLAWGDTEQ